jgi:choline dehydrogenase-like flavoprotein
VEEKGMAEQHTYDYVIVGAGSAGCVLARRLSEDPGVRVLLIEAGGEDSNELIHMPLGFGALLRSSVDWDYSSHYEPGCNGRRIYLPRGKVLGGSSSINAMVYIRGHRADYDEWRDLGCAGWGWADMLPCFLRAEDNERGVSEFHGVGGPLAVSDLRHRSPIAQAALEAALGCGLPANDDFNGAEQDGVGTYQVTQREGRRASTAACYLHPVTERTNLSVRTHVHVTQVRFDGVRAIGVAGVQFGRPVQFEAEREVIVCAGAYGSPQLLMLSGIGRPDELAALGIAPLVELPGVGRNLSDHPIGVLAARCAGPDGLFGAMSPPNLDAYAAGRGPLTSNVAESGGFIRTRDGLPAPDIQLFFLPTLYTDEALAPVPAHGVSIGACLLKPRARGQLKLVSPDPTAKPCIVHNYYQHPEDLRSQIEGLRTAQRILNAAPLVGRLADPVSLPASGSDVDLIAHIRATAQTTYHPVGTCAMGIGNEAVVDPELRVRGVAGLRVVDASVMPTVPRGNTNAPTIALAERAAELIRDPAALVREVIALIPPAEEKPAGGSLLPA